MRLAPCPLALALAAALAAGGAGAAPPPPAPPPAEAGPAYHVRLEVDLPALAIAGTIASGWLLKGSLAPPHCAPRCDDADLPSFDRWAAGAWDPTWKLVSDVGVGTVLAASAASLLVFEAPGHALNDLVVLAQAVLFANTAAIVTMMGVRRPRPFAYGDEAPLDERMDGNASLSFFSGHTAGTTAAAVATYATFRRLGRPVAAGVALGVGLSAATFVGVSRVAAGDHFPSDVLGGAVVGLSMGIVIPALHDRAIVVVPGAVGSGEGFSVVGAF